MSTPYPGEDPRPEVEADPTGVRALLSALPDPGPMPDHVMARISRSLEAEQQRRAFQGSASGSSNGDLIDLVEQRHARRPARTLAWVGTAAAAAVAVTVASAQLFGGGGSPDTAASYPAAERGAQDGASAGQEEDQEGSGAGAPAAPTTVDSAATSEDSAPAYSQRGIADLSQSQLSASFGTWLSAPTTSASGEAEMSAAEVDRCLALIEQPTGSAVGEGTYLIAAGSLDGEPIVAVARTEPAPALGWVLSADCASGQGQVLESDVPLE